jgi:hypothetical protein
MAATLLALFEFLGLLTFICLVFHLIDPNAKDKKNH